MPRYALLIRPSANRVDHAIVGDIVVARKPS
jgi:hypothetical protein